MRRENAEQQIFGKQCTAD